MKAGRIGVGVSTKIVVIFLLLAGGVAVANAIQAEGTKMSPGLAKVVQMIDSGVSDDVVMVYVQSATIPRPNADEVIQLHEAGVPDRVTLALLSKKQTSTERQIAASEQAPPSPAYAPAPATAPQTAPQTSVYIQRYPVYVQSEPTVVYSSPAYYEYYPYYRYSYGYWPAVSLGFGFGFGHPFFGHHGFSHGGGHWGGHGGWVGVGGHHGGGHWGRH